MSELAAAAVSSRAFGRGPGVDVEISFAPRNVEALVGMLSAWRGIQSGRAGTAQRLPSDLGMHAHGLARGGRGRLVADLPA
ncbi:hypothetical protein [Speluncibacter jeojiensis]|uniref:Uncharacterized protein n=1 Tax=Speluncibacter jeojiensis TaxID=2710754 RepID=A0A9X4M2Z9_9ACTN|nr:hypothetical protein [Corynebacteriales bacterium D3-21]